MTTKKDLKRRIERMDKELGEARNAISFLLRGIRIEPVVFTERESIFSSVVRVGYAYQGEYRRADYPIHSSDDIDAVILKDGKENTLINVFQTTRGIEFKVMLEKRSGNIIRLDGICGKEGENK